MKNTEMKERIKELEDDNNFLEFDNNRLTNLSTGRAHWVIGLWTVVIIETLILVFHECFIGL